MNTLENLLDRDLESTLALSEEALRLLLDDFHPEDIADALDDSNHTELCSKVVRALDNERAAVVMERLGLDLQSAVLNSLGPEESARLLGDMDPDDRVDFVQELPKRLSIPLLQALSETEPEAAEEVRELGVYAEDTAGGLMTPEYVALPPDTKVWSAIEEVRRLSALDEAETIYYIYVVFGDVLVGVVSLRDLLLRDPSKNLEDIMETHVVRVQPNDDQEEVASLIAKYNLSALPVVGEKGRMLGVITVDDMMDVVIEEATEDAQKMGGVVPLHDSYFHTGFGTFFRKRVGWLFVLFLGQLLTATVMERHDVASIAGLVVFIPLIIAAGGNSGAQSSSLVIRALAVGEMEPGDWVRVFVRELAMGITLGIVLGTVGFGRAWFFGNPSFDTPSLQLANTVAVSILAIVTLGTLMGSLLPLLIRRLGFDPAVSSTPFIASLVDVLGLILYFGIAAVIFGTVV